MYDNAPRLHEIVYPSTGGTGISATWSHGLANRRDGVTLGNDVTSSFDYDLADRLKNIQHAKDTTCSVSSEVRLSALLV